MTPSSAGSTVADKHPRREQRVSCRRNTHEWTFFVGYKDKQRDTTENAKSILWMVNYVTTCKCSADIYDSQIWSDDRRPKYVKIYFQRMPHTQQTMCCFQLWTKNRNHCLLFSKNIKCHQIPKRQEISSKTTARWISWILANGVLGIRDFMENSYLNFHQKNLFKWTAKHEQDPNVPQKWTNAPALDRGGKKLKVSADASKSGKHLEKICKLKNETGSLLHMLPDQWVKLNETCSNREEKNSS